VSGGFNSNISFDFIRALAAEMGNGHNMSTASWDNTEAAPMFNIDPFPVIAEKKVDFGIKLMMGSQNRK
jgi:hypothetical protein